VPVGGGGLVGTAQVAVFAAAVATGPAVIAKLAITVEGAESVNCSAAGCKRLVTLCRAKFTVAAGMPDTPLAGNENVTVDLGRSVMMTLAVSGCPFTVAVPVTVAVFCAAQAQAVRSAITTSSLVMLPPLP